MNKWKYTLQLEGEALRFLITKEKKTLENIIAIYKQIIVCLETWKKRLLESDREDWEYRIEAMIDDLRCACPDVEEGVLSYSEAEETLNCYLDDFYDMCDEARVWIGV